VDAGDDDLDVVCIEKLVTLRLAGRRVKEPGGIVAAARTVAPIIFAKLPTPLCGV